MKKILLINGPNLNLLGKREEEIYGTTDFNTILEELKDTASKFSARFEYFQSNHEGEIIDRMHQAIGNIDYIILNPGALTHYSYSIHDAIKAVNIPTATGVISGFGLKGYIMALDSIFKKN